MASLAGPRLPDLGQGRGTGSLVQSPTLPGIVGAALHEHIWCQMNSKSVLLILVRRIKFDQTY